MMGKSSDLLNRSYLRHPMHTYQDIEPPGSSQTVMCQPRERSLVFVDVRFRRDRLVNNRRYRPVPIGFRSHS